MSDVDSPNKESDLPFTPSRKKSQSIRLKRYGETSSLTSRGSEAKRPKKGLDEAPYAIMETKSPRGLLVDSPGTSADGHAYNPSSSQISPKSVQALSMRPPPESPPTLRPSASTPLPEGVLATGRHTHHGLKWLYEARTDKNRRRLDHPEYNPRTLYVPQPFLKAQTPAMQQWWVFKGDNMDTVLFFKVCEIRMILDSVEWLTVGPQQTLGPISSLFEKCLVCYACFMNLAGG